MKGAMMLVLSIWHPEIEDFIKAKLTPNRLTKFNLSVGITEGFMDAVINDSMWDLKFPQTSFKKYKEEWNGDLEEWESKGYPIDIIKTIKARYLWELIMRSTYERNDPGVLFLDKANKLNPLAYVEKIFGSNPCGEILMSTGVCNLGSLNLVKFVKYKDNQPYFDFDEYQKIIEIGVRFLDNINSIARTPLPEYTKAIKEKRRIGLGTMSLGSAHLMMLMRFGSKKSLEFIEKLYKTKTETELYASAMLGSEKGSFELFKKEKYFNTYWWKNLDIDKKIKNKIENIGCMRNSHHSMNAPTGNTGVFCELVSGGIEPVFMLEYIRWSIVNEHTQRSLKEQGFKFPDALLGEWFETEHMKFATRGKDNILSGEFNGIRYEVDKNRGLIKASTVEDYGWRELKKRYKPEAIEEFRKQGILATTPELTVIDHINTLSIIAKYTNMNNSKTTNLPNNYDYEEFKNLYMHAWNNNIKGITTYREGTASVVLEAKGGTDKRSAPKRPKKLEADIYSITVSGEKFIVAIGLFKNRPYEIFCGAMNKLNLKFKERKGFIEKIKRGQYKLILDDIEIDDFSAHFKEVEKALFRMVSMALRHEVNIKFIVEQLTKSTDNLSSLTAAASRVLKKYIVNGERVSGQTCSACSSTNLIYAEGCITCADCGTSKCS